MSQYRKKPVVISAIQWTGDNLQAVDAFFGDAFNDWSIYEDGDPWEGSLSITTLEGDHRAEPGDWIIRGIKGEFYPCKPDIFAATYEKVKGEADHE